MDGDDAEPETRKDNMDIVSLCFLCCFSIGFALSFRTVHYSSRYVLNLLTTNSGEAMELLDNLLPAVIGVFVVYLPTLALGIVSITGNKKLDQYFIYRQRRYARMTMGVGVILTALCYADHEDYALKLDMYPVNVCYNLTLAIERAGETAGYQESSKEFTFGAQATHDKDEAEIYVLVVGETARACNFGLYGYERNTTPLLDKTKGLVAFTDVLTQSNTTHKSVPMLLSGASAENYNRIYREKGIITAFKEAGFHTAFFPIRGLIILLLISSEWRRMNGNL